MDFIIDGVHYTGFVQDRDKLQSATFNAKITWMRARIQMLVINPLDQIYPEDAPFHQAVDNAESHFYLPCLTIIMTTIDFLGSLSAGDWAKSRHFASWIKTYMPNWRETTAEFSLEWEIDIERWQRWKGVAKDLMRFKKPSRQMGYSGKDLTKWLYHAMRCGLVHQFSIKDGGIDLQTEEHYVIDGSIVVNPVKFYTDFKQGVNIYFDALGRDENIKLRKNFSKTFYRVFGA